MNHPIVTVLAQLFSRHSLDLFSFFDDYHEGVIITDVEGRIRYYNSAQAVIDDLDPAAAPGKKITDLYDLTDESSTTMQCIRRGEPVRNRVIIYQTRLGKIANTISNVYPLSDDQGVTGAVSFTKDYQMLEDLVGLERPDQAPRKFKNQTRFTFNQIIGSDVSLMEAVGMAKLAAATPSPIMISGETGTGKELFAQSIHNHGPQADGEFIPVNCAAIPENLLEGILFGTSKGVFTGSVDKAGLFEQANGGTLFLDELDSMPLTLQAKLLRVIQEKKVRRLGAARETELNLKIISAVGRSPLEILKQDRLRQDLFYRMGVVQIMIPPLRHRRGDIPLLAHWFVSKFNGIMGQQVKQISPDVLALFNHYHWPGNVRELEHVIEGAMNLINGAATIEEHHLPPHVRAFMEETPAPEAAAAAHRPPPTPHAPGPFSDTSPHYFQRDSLTLVENQTVNEIEILVSALKKFRGNGSQAARSLGLSPQAFHYKQKKYGLDPKQFTR